MTSIFQPKTLYTCTLLSGFNVVEKAHWGKEQIKFFYLQILNSKVYLFSFSLWFKSFTYPAVSVK